MWKTRCLPCQKHVGQPTENTPSWSVENDLVEELSLATNSSWIIYQDSCSVRMILRYIRSTCLISPCSCLQSYFFFALMLKNGNTNGYGWMEWKQFLSRNLTIKKTEATMQSHAVNHARKMEGKRETDAAPEPYLRLRGARAGGRVEAGKTSRRRRRSHGRHRSPFSPLARRPLLASLFLSFVSALSFRATR